MNDDTAAQLAKPTAETAANDTFVSGGFIRKNFHESRAWQAAYERVAKVSSQFVSLAWRNGVGRYTWPIDPLSNWSRVWEYPFVTEQLRRQGCDGKGLSLFDVGAAVTFFPYYLIRRGFKVTNSDFDPNMSDHFQRTFRLAGKALGVDAPPDYVTADARDTKLPAEHFDVITCISVLEHIPQWERAVQEFNRLLKPRGLLILTFDVQHSGPADALSTEDFRRLFRLLSQSMDPLTTIEESVPADALTPYNETWQPPAPPRRSLISQLWPVTAWPRKLRDYRRNQRCPPAEI